MHIKLDVLSVEIKYAPKLKCFPRGHVRVWVSKFGHLRKRERGSKMGKNVRTPFLQVFGQNVKSASDRVQCYYYINCFCMCSCNAPARLTGPL